MDELKMTEKKIPARIGVACDGFSIDIFGEHYWINQEDDPSEALSIILASLGCDVTIEEDY